MVGSDTASCGLMCRTPNSANAAMVTMTKASSAQPAAADSAHCIGQSLGGPGSRDREGGEVVESWLPRGGEVIGSQIHKCGCGGVGSLNAGEYIAGDPQ